MFDSDFVLGLKGQVIGPGLETRVLVNITANYCCVVLVCFSLFRSVRHELNSVCSCRVCFCLFLSL